MRLLAAASEREVALMAESVIAGIATVSLPVPVWVHCPDRAILLRLTEYLTDFQSERAGVDAA